MPLFSKKKSEKKPSMDERLKAQASQRALDLADAAVVAKAKADDEAMIAGDKDMREEAAAEAAAKEERERAKRERAEREAAELADFEGMDLNAVRRTSIRMAEEKERMQEELEDMQELDTQMARRKSMSILEMEEEEPHIIEDQEAAEAKAAVPASPAPNVGSPQGTTAVMTEAGESVGEALGSTLAKLGGSIKGIFGLDKEEEKPKAVDVSVKIEVKEEEKGSDPGDIKVKLLVDDRKPEFSYPGKAAFEKTRSAGGSLLEKTGSWFSCVSQRSRHAL